MGNAKGDGCCGGSKPIRPQSSVCQNTKILPGRPHERHAPNINRKDAGLLSTGLVQQWVSRRARAPPPLHPLPLELFFEELTVTACAFKEK
jgi:hypothetical protein